MVLRRGVVSDTCNTLLVLLSIGEGSQLSALSVCHNDINNHIPTVILFTRHVINSRMHFTDMRIIMVTKCTRDSVHYGGL